MFFPSRINRSSRFRKGYFIGPYGADGKGALGIPARSTSALLNAMAQTGNIPAIDDNEGRGSQGHLILESKCLVLTQHPRLTEMFDEDLTPDEWREFLRAKLAS